LFCTEQRILSSFLAYNLINNTVITQLSQFIINNVDKKFAT